MSDASSDFRYSEAKLCALMSWPRQEAKQLRDRLLKKDADWLRVQGEIALSRRGLTRLIKKAGVPLPAELNLSTLEISNGREKKSIALPPLDAPRSMRITHVPLNPYIVRAQDKLGQDYTVRVAGNSALYVGLEIEARPDPAHDGIWRIHGPVPRWQGDRAYRSILQPSNAAMNGNGSAHGGLR